MECSAEELGPTVLHELESGNLNYPQLHRAFLSLCRCSQWEGLVSVFNASWNVPSLQERFTARIVTDFFFACMKLATRASIQHAFSIFKDIVGRGLQEKLLSAKGYNFLYVGLSRAELIDEATTVHDECNASGFYLNHYSYNSFLSACAKLKRVSAAFRIFRTMAEFNIMPDVVSCNILISCCVRSDEVDLALRVLERMRSWGIKPDVYSYNSVVNGLRKSQMLEEAFDLVAEMEIGAGDEPIEGRHPPGATKLEEYVRPDLVTYNTLISGIALEGVPDLDRVRAVHEHMKLRGIPGNNVTFNAMMSTAARSDRAKEAFEIYEEMLSLNMRPNCECFTTLISLCGQIGDVDRALSIHEKMNESGIAPNVVTYNALLNTCRHGDSDQAATISLEVFDMLRKSPDCDPDVISYSTLIDTLGRDGRFSEMHKILEEMTEAGVQPNLVTYTSMIAALSRVDDLDGAMRVLVDMEKSGILPNMYTFSCVLNGACRLGQVGRAFEILQMMSERDVSPSSMTYVTLLDMTLRTGSPEHIKRVLLEILKNDQLEGTPILDELHSLMRDRVYEQPRGVHILKQFMKQLREHSN